MCDHILIILPHWTALIAVVLKPVLRDPQTFCSSPVCCNLGWSTSLRNTGLKEWISQQFNSHNRAPPLTPNVVACFSMNSSSSSYRRLLVT